MSNTARPLSPARTHAGVVYTSGQVGIAPDGGVPKDFAGQFGVAIGNLRGVLADAGASLESVLKTTVFLVDRSHTDEMNRLYAEAFPEPRPARSTIVTQLVRPDLLFEIEAVAFLDESRQ